MIDNYCFCQINETSGLNWRSFHNGSYYFSRDVIADSWLMAEEPMVTVDVTKELGY
jgi:hypothetical protein